MLDAFLDGHGAGAVTDKIVVVGLGNSYRNDDGVGVAAAAALDDLALPRVRVVTGVVEPMSLLEAWSGARLAVVIDATKVIPSSPGCISRCALSDVVTASHGLSSHSVDIGRTHGLVRALGRVPDELVVFTIEVADTGHGVGLSPPVARAVPQVVGMAVDEINRRQGPPRRSGRPASR